MSEQYVPPTDWVREAAADMYANRVSRPAFDRWLAAVKAEVWDEGHDVGIRGQHDPNPYRAESEARP